MGQGQVTIQCRYTGLRYKACGRCPGLLLPCCFGKGGVPLILCSLGKHLWILTVLSCWIMEPYILLWACNKVFERKATRIHLSFLSLHPFTLSYSVYYLSPIYHLSICISAIHHLPNYLFWDRLSYVTQAGLELLGSSHSLVLAAPESGTTPVCASMVCLKVGIQKLNLELYDLRCIFELLFQFLLGVLRRV